MRGDNEGATGAMLDGGGGEGTRGGGVSCRRGGGGGGEGGISYGTGDGGECAKRGDAGECWGDEAGAVDCIEGGVDSRDVIGLRLDNERELRPN